MPQAKKTIKGNVALDKRIHWRIRLAFLRTALGLIVNQLTEDSWQLGSSPTFDVRKLTKNIACIMDFLDQNTSHI